MRDKDQVPDTNPEKKKNDDLEANEGEGSTSAARRYAEELDEFKKENNVEELADEAAKTLDEDEDAGEGTGRKVA